MGWVEAVEQVADGLTTLAEVDLDALSDEDLDRALVDLQRLGHRLAAQTCRVGRRWEQRGVWAGDGSKSSAARLARDGHTSQRAAREALLRSRRLEATPHVAAAFAAGDVSIDQVDLLLAAAAGRDHLFARDEEVLVEQACARRVAQLAKVLTYWRHRADAELDVDGAVPDEIVPVLTLSPIDGAVAIAGELDPIGGQVVATALQTIADELALADRAAGRPELTGPQLRAMALVEMARRAMAVPADGRPARILAHIACGDEAFARLCELSNGTIVRPARLVPYLDALDIRSIVFDSATHAVRTSNRRTFVGALRGVVEVRDRHCQHPSGCDEPIDACDVDHVVPWSRTHDTSQENGRLLCRFHNRIEPQYARPPNPADALASWRTRRVHLADLADIDPAELLGA